jgi:hypothetical protein
MVRDVIQKDEIILVNLGQGAFRGKIFPKYHPSINTREALKSPCYGR